MLFFFTFPFRPAAPVVIVLFIASLFLGGCAPIATVNEVAPATPVAFVVNQDNEKLQQARQEIKSAEKNLHSDPLTAMAQSEDAARLSLDVMKDLSGRREDEAIAVYNYAVSRLVEAMTASGQKPWEHEIQLNGPNGPLGLTLKPDSNGAYLPEADKLRATDRMEIGGTYFTTRASIDGVGAPFVSAGLGRKEAWAPDKHYYAVTAIITFSGNQGTLQVLDPVQTTTVDLAGQNYPVAADLSAPYALQVTETKAQDLGIKSLLRTDQHMAGAKLIMASPYLANRIPLILIHGLADSPVTWAPLVNALNSNPEIRKKYQIWAFRYPSGLPFPFSADVLRQALTEVYKKYPDTPKAVLIGHSMGGLVADMLIRDSNGNQYCEDLLGKPLDQFEIDPDELQLIQGSLVFKASPYVSRVVFIATPHRGAEMASNPLGRLGASLVHLPVTMVALGPKLIAQASKSNGEKVIARFPNSIDTLRPEAKVVVAMNKLPIKSSIVYYSIIGDRGEGDTPKSSDGVVAYTSSHLDGAKSELIVPVWHSYAQRCSQSLEEVQRILLQP